MPQPVCPVVYHVRGMMVAAMGGREASIQQVAVTELIACSAGSPRCAAVTAWIYFAVDWALHGCQPGEMGFFDDAPRGELPMPHGGPWDPPRHEFPRVAASALLLARTDVVAVFVAAVWAFREGFTFWVKAPFKETGAALQRWPDEEALHVGVQFADGRKAANAGRLPSPAGSVPAGLILRPHSFGGGPGDWNLSYWVWPLPPAGPVTFVCEWRALDIPETRADIDGQLILDAAPRSIQIWPNGHG